jgi:hypothetical protein
VRERGGMNLITNVYNMQDSSLKTTTMKNEFNAINVLTWADIQMNQPTRRSNFTGLLLVV